MKRIYLGLITLTLFTLYNCSSIKPEDYKKLQAENDNLNAENRSLTSDLNEQKERVASLQDIRDNLLKQLSKLSNDNVSLSNLVNSTKADLGRQINSYKKNILDNEAKMKNLMDDIKNRDSQIADLQNQIKSNSTEQAKLLDEKNREISNMNTAHSNLIAAMQQELAAGDMTIKQLGNELQIEFLDKIFFDEGSDAIKNSGKISLDKVAEVLKTIKDKQIRVEGYTDNVPIKPTYRWKFPSNWELSTARATTIVRYLQSRGVNPSLMKATGYGEYNPIASNDTEAGRAQNRRIAILLVQLDERSKFNK
jgi:chemotaxis protein MotB